MKQTLYALSDYRVSVDVAERSSNLATEAGATVDRWDDGQNFRHAMFLVVAGAITGGTHTVNFEHSTDGAAWEQIPAASLQGPSVVQAGTAQAQQPVQVGYVGVGRYLRATISVTGLDGLTTSGTVGAYVVLAYPTRPPVRRD